MEIRYIELTEGPGIFKIVGDRDHSKGGLYYPIKNGVYEFELKPGFDYIIVQMQMPKRVMPMFSPTGGINFLHIYRHQIERFL